MRARLCADACRLPLASGVAACIVTSPPYNVGIEYGEHFEDQMDWFDYANMADYAAGEMYRVAMPGARVWVNVQPTVPFEPGNNDRRVDLAHLWSASLEAAGWLYRDAIAWIQDSHDGACQWGSWLQPSAPNQRGSWEVVLSFYKETWHREVPPEWQGWRALREDEGGDWGNDLCRNVWRIPPARSDHPAVFPAALVARCVRLSTWPDEVVLDPFVGSGTTIDMAERLGRRGIGTDLSRRPLGSRQASLFETPEDADVESVVVNGAYL